MRCAGIKCGDLSHCVSGECLCYDGYAERDDVCEEICTYDTCQDWIWTGELPVELSCYLLTSDKYLNLVDAEKTFFPTLDWLILPEKDRKEWSFWSPVFAYSSSILSE